MAVSIGMRTSVEGNGLYIYILLTDVYIFTHTHIYICIYIGPDLHVLCQYGREHRHEDVGGGQRLVGAGGDREEAARSRHLVDSGSEC